MLPLLGAEFTAVCNNKRKILFSNSSVWLQMMSGRLFLYVRPSVPDNETSGAVIQDSRCIQQMPRFSFSDLIVDGGLVTQHCCCVISFCSLFYLRNGLHPISMHLLLCTLGALLVGVIVGAWNDSRQLKTVASFSLTLAALSPILKTITRDYSSDTIWTISCLLFFVNTVTQPYDTP